MMIILESPDKNQPIPCIVIKEREAKSALGHPFRLSEKQFDGGRLHMYAEITYGRFLKAEYGARLTDDSFVFCDENGDVLIPVHIPQHEFNRERTK